MGKLRTERFSDSNVIPSAIRRNYFKPMKQNNKPPYERYYRPFQSDRYGRHNRYQNNCNKKWMRPPSPVIGSEEYMNKKIQNTSALIMRQLLSPEENEPLLQDVVKPTDSENLNTPDQALKTTQKQKEKSNKKCKNKEKAYDVEEIHNKIMNHISNLNEGRKKNLIYSSNSDYDGVIQNMLKQKRLEISRALRNMCSGKNEITESSEFINSIIPDIGIKIEELPREFIEELTRTFDDQIQNFAGEQPREEHLLLNNSSDLQVTNEYISSSDSQEDVHSESIKEDKKIEETVIDIKQEIECSSVDMANVNLTINESVMENRDCDMYLSGSDILNNTANFKQGGSSSPRHIFDNEIVIDTSKDIVKEESEDINTEIFLKKWFNKMPESLEQAVNRMFKIDEIISQLTTYRQDLFSNFVKKPEDGKKEVITRIRSENSNNTEGDTNPNNSQVNETYCMNPHVAQGLNSEMIQQRDILELQEIQEKMLALKVVGEQLIAGSESGKIFFCNLNTGIYTHITQLTMTPITSLSIIKDQTGNISLYVGSFENSLNIYNLQEHRVIKSIELEDSAQCMEASWGYIFIGSRRGFLFRYSAKKEDIESEEKISTTGIQVLKATNEGARRVLLVASGDSILHIRDAISGLYLRTIEPIYATATCMKCLIFAQSNLYCGTNNELLVFSFHDGMLTRKLGKNSTIGVNDLKILGQLLFAACTNGEVNVYSMKSNQFLGSISGPGGSIITMEVLYNQIIMSTISSKFKSIPIPEHILLHK